MQVDTFIVNVMKNNVICGGISLFEVITHDFVTLDKTLINFLYNFTLVYVYNNNETNGN